MQIALLAASCSNSNYVGDANKKTGIGSSRPSGEDAKSKSGDSRQSRKESFTLSPTAGKVDIVWIVDQSGSMLEETDHVQKNLKEFFSRIDAASDARLALIAAKRGMLGLDLESIGISSEKVKQIDYEVQSNDALEIAVAAFSRQDVTTMGNSAFEIQGSLEGFFRPSVKPVIVVVTDDDAYGVDSNNFMEQISDPQKALGFKPVVFAFAGLKESTFVDSESTGICEVSSIGRSYIELAKQSEPNGAVFDICEKDWTKNFQQLSAGVLATAENSLKLKNATEKILQVTLNGQKLDASKYTFANGLVSIHPSALVSGQENKIEIEYL
jgi:hypothetical protein